MTHLKLIFYGLLAFIERNPIFCLILVLLAIFAPVVFEVVGWIILGIIALLLLGLGLLAWMVYKMQREMKRRFEQAANAGGFDARGFNAGGAQGFSGFGFSGNMSLEDLVRMMQQQADMRQQQAKGGGAANSSTHTSGQPNKRVNDKVGDYVDFEEVD